MKRITLKNGKTFRVYKENSRDYFYKDSAKMKQTINKKDVASVLEYYPKNMKKKKATPLGWFVFGLLAILIIGQFFK